MLAFELLGPSAMATLHRRLNQDSKGFGRRPERTSGQASGGKDAILVYQGVGMRGLTRLLGCEKGASAIEYALVATLISIAAIGAFNNLGNKINTMYNNVGNAM